MKINIITKRGVPSTLTLKNVVYIEGLNRRLFSVMAFCKNQNYYITFNSRGGTLHFGDGNSVQTTYAPFQTNEQGMQITDDHTEADPVEEASSEEGESSQTVEESHEKSQQNITNNPNTRRDNVKTKDIELFHQRLGFIPLRDLLMGSQHHLWRDTIFRLSSSGTFNNTCKITIVPRNKLSRTPFPQATKSFQ